MDSTSGGFLLNPGKIAGRLFLALFLPLLAVSIAISDAYAATTDNDFENGSRLAQEGDINAARKLLAKVIMKKVTDPTSLARRAMAYRVLTEYGRALTDSTEALRQDPKLAEAYMTQGICLYYAPDYRMAASKLDKAISMNKQLGDAHVWRGLLYCRSGDYEFALNSFTTALELHAKRPDALCGRALASMYLGQYDRAEKDLALALSFQKDYPEAVAEKAFLQVLDVKNEPMPAGKNLIVVSSLRAPGRLKTEAASKKALKLAVEESSRALVLKAKMVTAYSARALAFDRLGDKQKSYQDYSMALDLEPNDPRLYNNFGVACTRGGDYDLAIKNFTKAYSMSPTYYSALVNKAAVHVLKQEFDKAIRDATTAIKIKPQYPQGHRARELALIAAGRKNEAKADIEHASKLLHKNTFYLLVDP